MKLVLSDGRSLELTNYTYSYLSNEDIYSIYTGFGNTDLAVNDLVHDLLAPSNVKTIAIESDDKTIETYQVTNYTVQKEVNSNGARMIGRFNIEQ